MAQANAAQVLSGFIWNNKLENKILTGNPSKGFFVDETYLLKYLMDFQEWVYNGRSNSEQSAEVISLQEEIRDYKEKITHLIFLCGFTENIVLEANGTFIRGCKLLMAKHAHKGKEEDYEAI